MALILAIEPDRRQASQLTAIVRGRLRAELVLGESAERALAALGHRVPDLILTSALLSPRDEATLGDRLRALDGAAVHVQTLTIPVLAMSSDEGGGRIGSVLSALRREKTRPAASDGCDPDVFAEQCKEYLDRAAAEQAIEAERAALLKQDEAAAAETKRAHPKTSERPLESADRSEEELRAAPATDGSATRAKTADPIILPSAEPIDEWEAEAAESFAPPRARTFTPAHDGPITPAEAPSIAAPQVPSIAQAEVPRTSTVAPPAEAFPMKPARNGEKTKERNGLRDILGLRPDSGAEGPASLLAAVAALEAEQQVQAAPVTLPSSFVDPAAKPFAMRDNRAAPDFPGTPTPTPRKELDLSSLLDDLQGVTPRRGRSSFDDDPVVDVHEIDNALLAGPLDAAKAAPAKPEKAPEPVAGRNWPELDHLENSIKEVKAAEVSAPRPATPPTPAPGQQPATSVKPDERKHLSDILEALRRDAEQLLAKPAPIANAAEPPARRLGNQAAEAAAEQAAEQAAEPATDAQAADGSRPDLNGIRKKKKRAKDGPAPDEWGFFDPDQCGFAALIEKLEEITDEDDTPAPKRGRV